MTRASCDRDKSKAQGKERARSGVEGTGQITIQSTIVHVVTAERKGKGKCRGDGVVWQAQPGRWRGAIHLSSYKYVHFLPFPFFRPQLGRPAARVCFLSRPIDKVSPDHPLPGLLINSCLSVLLPIILTPHPHSHHESPRHLLVSRLFKTDPPQAIPRPSCPTSFKSFPNTSPASVLTHCYQSVHSPFPALTAH
jgi:hypothetical protein